MPSSAGEACDDAPGLGNVARGGAEALLLTQTDRKNLSRPLIHQILRKKNPRN
jgi:hypothetical protein